MQSKARNETGEMKNTAIEKIEIEKIIEECKEPRRRNLAVGVSFDKELYDWIVSIRGNSSMSDMVCKLLWLVKNTYESKDKCKERDSK